MAEGRLTDEAIAEFLKRSGKYRAAVPWNKVATEDAIRHFALGIGDDNPLWNDPAYAEGTRWGRIIAPPSYLLTTSRGGGLSRGLPGVQGVQIWDEYEWFRPVYAGDIVTCWHGLKDFVPTSSEHAARAFDQITESVCVNQNREVVAVHLDANRRFERNKTEGSSGRKRYEGWRRWIYSSEDLESISKGYAEEAVRGAEPRYWEDVREGEELQPVVKGPLTVTEVIAWCCGAGAPLIMASRIRWNYFRKHPGANVPDRETNTPDVPERIHWETTLARTFGAPDLFDIGVQRLAWLGHLVTNWIGDDGFLRRLRGESRRFNLHGDTCWVRGKVIRKYKTGEEYLVDCDLRVENQRGEVLMPGSATASLPSRERGLVILPASPALPAGIDLA
ncbi:MAG: MaoC family dehydratase N-terminal domain-containing protein [Chloroflexi bacterium]|nr:MaoC family dehydratase N-terminal domain-containing protein [Chloroflexota bacterium]